MFKSYSVLIYLIQLLLSLWCGRLIEVYAEEKKEGTYFDSSIRARYELVDWLGSNTLDRKDTFSHLKLQTGLGYQTENFRVYSQLQVFQLVNLEGSDTGSSFVYRTANNGENNPTGFSFRQAYLNGNSVLVENLYITIGRILYSSGMEAFHSDPTVQLLKKKRIADRIVGSFDFTGGRSFDGIRGDLKNKQLGDFTLMASHPTQGGFETNISKDIDKLDLLNAVYTTNIADDKGEFQIFYYYYNDDRGVFPIDNRFLDIKKSDLEEIQINTIGTHLVRSWDVEDGTFESLIWGAYQNGDWGSQSHEAFSIDLETGYKFERYSFKPWIRFGYTYGSGDSNQSDNKHKTFFQMLPTVRMYAQTPFYNMMNTHDFYTQFIITASESLNIKSELHFIQLAETRDLLYSGGGAGERQNRFGYAGFSASGGSKVGTLLDLDLTYQIGKNLSATFYYGHLFGGEIFAEDDQIDYGFLELNYKI